MSRAARLLDLLQVLRRHRGPVRGQALADELGVSLRTLYRDIDTLKAQGAAIDGEAGLGYVLRPGFLLPPLTFTEAELDALVLGSRWVIQRGDAPLARAAQSALARIASVLPETRRELLDGNGLLVGPGKDAAASPLDLEPIRSAIRGETKLGLSYRDGRGELTERLVWPVALAFFDRVRIVVAWCESRAAFRHFRVDRIESLTETGVRYPRRRRLLAAEWRQAEGVPPQ